MVYELFRGKKAVRASADTDQCEGKNRYKLKEAISVVKWLHKMGRFRRARIYECPMCGLWHIARSRD
jgi:predicted RNA-binding Zn-ribbon protein involved in translation (DUF1610 family)